MISATIEKLIDQVVLDRIGGQTGQTFSAYDITRDVRNLTTEIFYHGDAKGYIHAKLQDSQMFDQQDSGSGYILYVRNHIQPQPLVVNNPAKTATNKSGMANSLKSFGVLMTTCAKKLTAPSGVLRKPDARGTISIPTAIITALGVSPGDCVEVNTVKNKLLIRPRVSGTHAIHPVDALYTVDRSGNVRITKATLNKAGIQKNAVVRLEKDRIVVE